MKQIYSTSYFFFLISILLVLWSQCWGHYLYVGCEGLPPACFSMLKLQCGCNLKLDNNLNHRAKPTKTGLNRMKCFEKNRNAREIKSKEGSVSDRRTRGKADNSKVGGGGGDNPLQKSLFD